MCEKNNNKKLGHYQVLNPGPLTLAPTLYKLPSPHFNFIIAKQYSYAVVF